jgi:endonuclease/exonuclease/phosphatase family metal-dependent hydrolase
MRCVHKRDPRLLFLIPLLVIAGCAGAPREAAAPLRVMTYNIHAGKDAAQEHNLERVAQVIREAAADVVLLQEIDRGTERSGREDQIATLARLTAMNGAFAKSLDYQGGEYGIAVLSRFPLDSIGVIHLEVQPPQERSGGAYEPRVGLHVSARTPRGDVHIVNTHLDPAAQPTYRHQEIIGLLAHIARTVPEQAALILGGDLNARPDTPEIAALTLAFTDAWTRCGTGGPGHSFPAHQPDRRIDYIFFRSSHCASARVIDVRASDHRPVIASVSTGAVPGGR